MGLKSKIVFALALGVVVAMGDRASADHDRAATQPPSPSAAPATVPAGDPVPAPS